MIAIVILLHLHTRKVIHEDGIGSWWFGEILKKQKHICLFFPTQKVYIWILGCVWFTIFPLVFQLDQDFYLTKQSLLSRWNDKRRPLSQIDFIIDIVGSGSCVVVRYKELYLRNESIKLTWEPRKQWPLWWIE